MLVRGPNLEATMSRYLVDRISGLPNVEVLTRTEVSGLEGKDGRLEAITWRTGDKEERHDIRHLCSSALTRIPAGCAIPPSPSTRTALCSLAAI